AAPRGLACDLDRPERQGGDAERYHAAAGGRLGARNPRAGQRGRAAPRPRAPVALAVRRRRVYAVPVRRIHAPALVALAAGLAGAIGIASVLTPEFAARTRLVDGILPPGWPDAARTLTLVFSLALLVLARGLARRKRRAWQLAVGLVIGSAITHVAK